MTKQQLKDYDKVVTTANLDVYLDTNPMEYGVDHPVDSYEDIPVRCAVSDMETFVDNWQHQLYTGWIEFDDEEYGIKELKRRIREAKKFIKKYGTK